jgi:HD-GYP domain-containing protein (c-di-GMP phosphodiesterase class II)
MVSAVAKDPNSKIVALSDLIVGRTTTFPIFDDSGVLLLAEGMVVTSEIKLNLRQRGSNRVVIHTDDVGRLTMKGKQSSSATPLFSFDSEITSRLDALIDSGLMTVKNTGPAVKGDVVFLGRKGYDKEQRARLLDAHDRNGAALSEMMGDALKGAKSDGSVVAAMATSYLKEMCADIDNTLTSTIDRFGENDLASRSLEVALLAMAIGIEMNLDADCIKEIGIAGLVHDWGMMKVPADYLNSARKLNDIERLEIKKHPIYSLEMLQTVSSLPRVISVVAYQVHECFNGSGYPRGRNGTSIHMFARILKVADAYCALTMMRPFRPPVARYGAMECLIHQARARSTDPDVVRALLKVVSLFPIGSYIALSDGSVARVLRRNKEDYSRPIVLRIEDAQGQPVDESAEENIIDLANCDLTVVQALPAPGTTEVLLSPELQSFHIS